MAHGVSRNVAVLTDLEAKMIRRWRPVAFLSLVLGLAAGCEPIPERSLESPTAPEMARPSFADVADASGKRYTLVEGRIPSTVTDLSVSKTIGAEGGSLSLAGHTLTVPEGAVDRPTLFVMDLLTNGFVQVELRALEVDPLLGLVDVGERGFARPVPISLTYAWASNADEPERLRILHLREDGVAEPLATRLDKTGKTVSAELEHFSRYCMAMD